MDARNTGRRVRRRGGALLAAAGIALTGLAGYGAYSAVAGITTGTTASSGSTTASGTTAQSGTTRGLSAGSGSSSTTSSGS
jgi:type IV secretory pathway TrbL component